jgi:hypothetical protein
VKTVDAEKSQGIFCRSQLSSMKEVMDFKAIDIFRAESVEPIKSTKPDSVILTSTPSEKL